MPDEVMTLWEDPALHPVTLTVLPGPDAGAPCVLVLPGGGYGHLADHEAEPVAMKIVEAGFNAAVLRYRLGSAGHRHPGMLNDAQRAIRLLRERGCSRVGVLGFSAGGHLASTVTVYQDAFPCEDDDLLHKHTARPDAALLCYAVIDLVGDHAHIGSGHKLLGETPSEDDLLMLSASRHVTADTPPTFLWHTNEDKGVPPENALGFAAACRAHRVPVELHLYERGHHGIGLADGGKGNNDFPEVSGWIDLAIDFCRRHLRKDA